MYTVTLLLSLLIGSFLGLLYGLSLGFIQGKVSPLFYSLISLIRIIIIGAISYYLLRYDLIHFILLCISFTGIYWTTILTVVR